LDGFHRVGNLRPNGLPELKPFLRRYPIQLRPTVGRDELHRTRLQQFSYKDLVKLMAALPK
jgi:hypothetical protein